LVSDRETPPPKKDVARALLLRGSLFVYLDPRASGVAVPSWFARQAQLVLQVGLDLPVPIPDLRVDDEGVFGTLSFNRAPFTCFVPWSAVFALVGDDGMGMVWQDDLPSEIAAEVEHGLAREAASASRNAGGPKLRAIDGGASEPTPEDDAEPGADPVTAEATGDAAGDEDSGSEPPPPRPTHLRLIK
jgi:stringent starvation protein B